MYHRTRESKLEFKALGRSIMSLVLLPRTGECLLLYSLEGGVALDFPGRLVDGGICSVLATSL